MGHWSERYVGLPWIEGEFDCADLCALVRAEVFGQPIALPPEHGAGPFGRSAAIARHAADYAVPTDAPVEGDAVLMLARGRVQHIGVLCEIAGERWVLHNQQTGDAPPRGHTVLTRVRELGRYGYRIEGYYRWL